MQCVRDDQQLDWVALLLGVKVVLAPDERSKGVLKTTKGVMGNSTMEILSTIVKPNPDRALVTITDVTGMSAASIEGTLAATVVTGITAASKGVLVTTVEVATATCDSTTGGLVAIPCADLSVSIVLVTSIMALCILSLKVST